MYHVIPFHYVPITLVIYLCFTLVVARYF